MFENKVKDIQHSSSISTRDRPKIPRKVNLFQDNFGFLSQQSSWGYFNRGLLWGGIIGLTAVFSASCGIALARIESVERVLVGLVGRNAANSPIVAKNSLNKLVNILILEVESNQEEIVQFSPAFTGKSQTIFLFQLEPQSNTAKVVYIPVDSRVKIPEFGWGTIADANSYGGTQLVTRSLARLLNGVTVDRYIRATPETFAQLIASGKVDIDRCNRAIQECDRLEEQIARQQTTVETIRQRLNIPSYFESFQATLAELQPSLDTDLSPSEVNLLAEFVKDLAPENINVELVAGYTPGQVADVRSPLQKTAVLENIFSRNYPIAVQNTTDNHELGIQFVSYLRRQDFPNVRLVQHIPLKLDKTRIMINQGELAQAKQLKNAIGFGRLEPKSSNKRKPLTIQIGKDANYLPLDSRQH
ncbi:MAG: LCP family protein [Cyanobacteria bacterium P01_G01_bin.19]